MLKDTPNALQMYPKVYGLVDCNNFYVSCERVFNPSLRGVPVAVLSNNDGCIVARSNELKNAGIPMGVPYFQVRDQLRGMGAKVLSSNYALYGDMSRRVMQVLATFTSDIEFYSIDEAFIALPRLTGQQGRELALEIRRAVVRATGIPVTVGLGPTKTLAKAASELAKQDNRGAGLLDGVLDLQNCPDLQPWLSDLDVKDIWGVGRQYAKFLRSKDIHNAWQLTRQPDGWIKRYLHLPGLKMVQELRGIACYELETSYGPRKGIVSSRSFGRTVLNLPELKQAVSSYVSRAAEKLRRDGTVAGYIQVFIVSDPEHDRAAYYKYETEGSLLPGPTDYTPEMTRIALEVLEKLYKPGKRYKKAGVFLGGIVPKSGTMTDLFDLVTPKDRKRTLAMAALDRVNAKYGNHSLVLASSGVSYPWQMKNAYRSPRFTTIWEEILRVRA